MSWPVQAAAITAAFAVAIILAFAALPADVPCEGQVSSAHGYIDADGRMVEQESSTEWFPKGCRP